MKKITFLALCSFVFVAVSVSAQTPNPDESETSPTSLESLLARKGVPVVADVYDLGEVLPTDYKGEKTKSLRVGCRGIVVYIPGIDELTSRGLYVDVHYYTKTHTSTLALGEIEDVSEAVDNIIELATKWEDTDREFTLVNFSTRDDLSIGFTQRGKDQEAFVSSGTIQEVEIKLDSLQELKSIKNLLDNALKFLKEK